MRYEVGCPLITITLLEMTLAVMSSNWRSTGNPAGPEPRTLMGKETFRMLPLPANVVNDGASTKTQLGTILVASVTTLIPATVAIFDATSSMASLRRSVKATTPPGGVRCPRVA